jgi:hypothetical protein
LQSAPDRQGLLLPKPQENINYTAGRFELNDPTLRRSPAELGLMAISRIALSRLSGERGGPLDSAESGR